MPCSLRLFLASIALLGAAVALPGCQRGDGPETARVYGTVTLDGQPLANASVMFIPENGRPAGGVTDAEGKYELMFTATQRGATLGEHLVRVSTYREAGDDEETPERVPEKVPAKYNVRTELRETVSGGSNEINLDLDSEGPVLQPDDD